MTPSPTQWPHTTLQFRGDTLEGIKFHGPHSEDELRRNDIASSDQYDLNDALAAKVAEWKARAEKAEAALKAAEDDRHLTTPCV